MTSQLLLQIPYVSAFTLFNGDRKPISNNETLQCLQVGIDSDIFLQLYLPSGLNVLIPAHAKVYTQEHDKYVFCIDDSVFQLQFHSPQDMHQFNVILSQYTAFVLPDYQVRDRLVLVDESDGSIIGDFGDITAQVSQEDKSPVEVAVGDDNVIKLTPAEDSKVLKSANYLSTGILYMADAIGMGMNGSADLYIKLFAPGESFKPTQVNPAVKTTVKTLNQSSKALKGVSSQSVKMVSNAASYFGSKFSAGGEKSKPGFLNKWVIAFDTIAHSLEESAERLAVTGTESASKVIGNHYGHEAANVARELGDTVKNVALVYIDARGLSRRAFLKAMGKGALVGHTNDGQKLTLTG